MTGKIWLEANTYSNRGQRPRKSNGHAAPACLEGSTGSMCKPRPERAESCQPRAFSHHYLHPRLHRHLEHDVVGRGLEPKDDEVNAPKGLTA